MVGVGTDDKLRNRFVCAPAANVPKVSYPIKNCANNHEKMTRNVKSERNICDQVCFRHSNAFSAATLCFVITPFLRSWLNASANYQASRSRQQERNQKYADFSLRGLKSESQWVCISIHESFWFNSPQLAMCSSSFCLCTLLDKDPCVYFAANL